jgi:glucokinase
MTKSIIALDLGGTRIRVGRMDTNLNMLQREETLTQAHEGLEPTMERIKDQIRRVFPDDASDVLGIGVSAPGPLNPETSVIVHPPNLPGWVDVPLGDILNKEFGVPVYTGNDANVAILAEAARGAAKGYRHAIYVTVSTGIGSGILVDGRLLLGRRGLAAEAGHMVMLVQDRVSSLENEAAGPDMAEQAVAAIQSGEKSSISDLVNNDLTQVNGATVGKAAQNGDPLALRIVERSGRLVGMGIVNLLHLFNPEIIVVGGGVTSLGDLLFKPMRESIEAYCIDDDYWKDLIITTPDLGEDVSIVGAGTLVVTEGGKRQLHELLD